MRSLLNRFSSTAEMLVSLAVYAAAEVARITAAGLSRAALRIAALVNGQARSRHAARAGVPQEVHGSRLRRAVGTIVSVNDLRLFELSGYAQPDVKRAAAAGLDGHVAKPCDVEQIERLLS